MMISALFAVSACTVTPLALNAPALPVAGVNGSELVVPRRRYPGVTGAALRRCERPGGASEAGAGVDAAVPAAQQRAQRLRHARGIGVPEIDDEEVAAGASRRVELLDQLPHARGTRRILAAHQHAVAARVGHERHALRRVGRRRPRARAPRSSAGSRSVTMSSAEAWRTGTTIGSRGGGLVERAR